MRGTQGFDELPVWGFSVRFWLAFAFERVTTTDLRALGGLLQAIILNMYNKPRHVFEPFDLSPPFLPSEWAEGGLTLLRIGMRPHD